MTMPLRRVRPFACVILLVGFGCAHRGVAPFIAAPEAMTRSRGEPPACFTGALADCLGGAHDRDRERTVDAPWWEPFQPDVSHRVCRGDAEARRRFRDGVRSVTGDAATDVVARRYLELIGGCSTPGFCEWAVGLAADAAEPAAARLLMLESVRRGCTTTLDESRLEAAAASLGRSLADQPPWQTGSRDAHCAALDRLGEPWDDLAAQSAAGCLDLVAWRDHHQARPEAVAAALERCVEGREIRYREAECLRELAGLDHRRAVAWLEARDRRGWGLSSEVTRYARTLLRFPAEHQLEQALAGLGLIPIGPLPAAPGSGAAVLPEEILERHGRLLRFNPSCAPRYCEHAPLAYELAGLVSPVLDGLIFDERWPALAAVDLGTGPRAVSSSVRGIPVTFHVAASDDDDGIGFDSADLARLQAAFETAVAAPHVLEIYDDGHVYHLPIRRRGEWLDLAALVGALNSILTEHHSPLRLVTLDPHCMPCARVVAGPAGGLIAAAFDGLIEPVDPFKELWVEPGFDPGR